MPRIEAHLRQPYAAVGYRALGIHVGPDVTFAARSREEAGTTFPVAMDFDGAVLDAWARTGTDVPTFPLAYLLSRTGAIAAIFTGDEPAVVDLTARVRALLD